MNLISLKVTLTVIVGLMFSSVAAAAEMDHSKMDHSGHNMHGPAVTQTKSKKSGKLRKLSVMPPSGQAREAGSDGRYVMEPTSNRDTLANKCALAARGVIMLDNATWKRCGGKPKGASMGAKKTGGDSHQHMNH